MATSDQEREKMCRQLRELFAGRLSEDEVRAVLRNFDWDLHAATDFVWRAEPSRVRQLVNKDEEVIRAIQRETQIVGRMLDRGWRPGFQVRQFACGRCDNMWWRKVPTRKEVSKCKKCQEKYDAIPRDQEYGLARFKCECGSQFTGFGWMGKTVSPCYNCRRHARHQGFGRGLAGGQQNWGMAGDQARPRNPPGSLPRGLCLPYAVVPPSKGQHGRPRRSADTHCCNARNCWQRLEDPDAPVLDEDACVHPKARMRQALLPSNRHASTGSTVATWLTQDDLREAWNDVTSTLNSIPEDDDDDDDDDDDNGDDGSEGGGGPENGDNEGFQPVNRRRGGRRGGSGNEDGCDDGTKGK